VRQIALFHSVYGLRPAVLTAADALRAAGHAVATPDLFDGRTARSLAEGFAISADVGWATIMRRAHDAVRGLPADTVLAGLSMGVGVATELLAGRPGTAGLLLLHGIGPVRHEVPVQVHVGGADTMFPAAEVADWQRTVPTAEVFTYRTAAHFFTDPGVDDYDESVAHLAWQRAIRFVGSL
jgi:dienelactone hydrolase